MGDLTKYKIDDPSRRLGSNLPIGIGASNAEGSPNLTSFSALSPTNGSHNPRLPFANLSYPSQVR